MNNYEIEIDERGQERKLNYIYGGDGLFAIYTWTKKSGGAETKTMYYIHKDLPIIIGMGSYETITDKSGNIVEKLNFDPWGRRRNPITWDFTSVPSETLFDRGYTGHQHMDDYGLVNMNGRLYDPWLGRMLSPDPVLQSPANSQNYNRYSYAMPVRICKASSGNNPLKYTDPSGYMYGPKNEYEPEGYIEEGNYSHNVPVYDDKGAVISFGFGGNNFIGSGFLSSTVLIPYDTDKDGKIDGYKFHSVVKDRDGSIVHHGKFSKRDKKGEDKKSVDNKDTDDQDDKDDIPKGGVMFYDEAGNLLYASGKGSENIIYTVSAGDISDFQKALSVLNPKSSPLTLEEAQLLATVYGKDSYSVYVGNGANGIYILGSINVPWYMYTAAALSIVGEGMAAGYNSGRAYHNYGRDVGSAFNGHYSSSTNYGVTNYWRNYFTPKRFSPWW